MTFKEQVAELLEAGLKEKPSLFLIDLAISESNKIIVTLDGDNGVTLQDCIDISRAIEHNLDREAHDFSLEVASAGVSSPLKLARQYKKNIGRSVEVTMNDETKKEGVLTEVNEEGIVIEFTEGKGKKAVNQQLPVSFSDIKQTKVLTKFYKKNPLILESSGDEKGFLQTVRWG